MKRIIFLVITFLIVTSIFGEKLGTITEVVNPYLMEVQDQDLYIVEGHTIYIYSLKDLNLKKKFGKRGEGPGEFMVSPTINMGSVAISVYPEFIVVNDVGRVHFFTRDGQYIREIKSKVNFGWFKPVGEKFIGYGGAVEDNTNYVTLKLYDSKLKEGKEFYRQRAFFTLGKAINPFTMSGPLFYVCDNKIYVEKDKSWISVFDINGKKISSIDINQGYKKTKVTQKDKTKYSNYFKTEPAFRDIYEVIKKNLKFPGYFPGIRYFYLAEKKIYIIRWDEEDGKSLFFVYDLGGKVLKKAWMPFFKKDVIKPYSYSIKNGILYQLVEDEENEGEWHLYATEIK